MITRANRCWLGPASVAVGLWIVPIVPFGGALAAERNLDTRSDRAARSSQTGLESTMKKIRKKEKTEAQKKVVIPKKKGPPDP